MPFVLVDDRVAYSAKATRMGNIRLHALKRLERSNVPTARGSSGAHVPIAHIISGLRKIFAVPASLEGHPLERLAHQ